MPRAIWTGAISFGLVSVPVKLYAAVSAKGVHFHQLHAADGVRIQQKRICPADGEEVAYSDIVKGYEIAPDRYVVIEPEELASLAPKRARTIEIEDFVALAEIDPIFFDHPYYLVPDERGIKPYRLLLAAMRETEMVALGRLVLRAKEHLVAIRAADEVMTLETMVFADEIVSPDRFAELDGEVATSDRELAVAKQLIESLSGSFEPEKYRDEYRDQVLALIDRKASGEEIVLQPQAQEDKVDGADLMSALQASLEEVKKRTGAGPKRSRKATGNGGEKKSSATTGRKPAAKRG
ncbi:MAG: end-binding protein Ku [Solirubrobacteraceae bacterium]|jgi:DNA end-binding protein Ku|nr:end-binding protein Ku [Solirubrobacteraceae bacterium]MEA2356196.1 end-binding protein Ku [Solirubrobacteraceae bacterium]